jgi:DNA-binding MarR family transcriptional regulator
MTKRKQGIRTLRTDAAAALDADLGLQARLLARRITAELDRALVPAGLTSTQFGLMCLIAAAPDDTIAGLAQRAGLNQSTMSRNVDQLVGTGLAEVVASEADRRRRAVWLTEAGATRLAHAHALWQPANQALAEKLGFAGADVLVEAAAGLGE